MSLHQIKLNQKQRALAEAPKGRIICIAGAGTGKTATLVEKVRWAIEHQGIRPDEILIVTFTRKAANEIKERLIKFLGEGRGSAIYVGTLNSMCANLIIAPDPQAVGYHSPRRPIIAEDGYYTLLRELYGKAKKDNLEDIARDIENSVIRGIPFPDAEIELPNDNKIKVPGYQLEKQIRDLEFSTQMITFTDQIYFAYKRLKEDEGFRHRLGARYKLVICDEGQDNSYQQNRIILYLSEVHNNVVFVGDDAQSMYTWRGADPEYFLDLHNKEKFLLLTLDENYRSTQPILDLGNAVIEHNFKENAQIEKYLKSTKPRTYTLPGFTIVYGEQRHVSHIGEKIQRWIDNGVPPKEIAVLCRSVLSGSGRPLQMELRKRSIEYRVVGGSDIGKSQHVSLMCSCFALSIGSGLGLDWQDLFGMLPGIGAKKAETLSELALAGKWGEINTGKTVPAKSKAHVMDLIKLIRRIRDNENDPYACAGMFYDWYIDLLRTLDWEPDAIAKAETILSIVMGGFEEDTLEKAVENIRLDPEEPAEDPESEKRKVVISTIHRAKGLEWDNVIIPDCSSDMFPHPRSTTTRQRQEECRVLHVGVTRARNELYLTMCKGPTNFISHFIDQSLVRVQTIYDS